MSSPSPAETTHIPPPPPPPPPPLKDTSHLHRLQPRAKRTKTGCYCCRLRKKKCDEQRPSCRACERLQLLCSWPTDGTAESNESEFAWRLKLKSGLPVQVHAAEPHQNASAAGSAAATATAAAAIAAAARKESSLHASSASSASLSRQAKMQHDAAAAYAHLTSVFHVAPQLSLIDKLFTDCSYRNLLEFYSRTSAACFVQRPSDRNPYVRMVLPIAHSSTMVLNAVLAVAGVHGGYAMNCPKSTEMARKHYTKAVQDVRAALTSWVAGSRDSTLQLLVTTTLLTQYECISGNQDGVMFHHMLGSRQFALYAMDHISTEDDKDLLAFLLEVYCYFELLGNMRHRAKCVHDMGALLSLKQSSTDFLQGHKDFGVLFGQCYDLFKLIPRIAQLAAMQRQHDGSCPQSTGKQLYQALQQQILSWPCCGPVGMSLMNESAPTKSAETGVVLILQTALLVFLHLAFYQHRVPHAELVLGVEPLVSQGLSYFVLLKDAPAATVTYWPLMVFGCCTTTNEQRARVRYMLKADMDPTRMPLTDRGLEVLGWLWEDPSEESFGLAGLERVIDMNDTDICIG